MKPLALSSRCHLIGLFSSFLDGPYVVEGLLRHIVVLAVHDFAEASNRVFKLDVLAFQAGELSGDKEWL